MIMRNWIELAVLLLIITVGISVKLWTRKRLKEIDGIGPITTMARGVTPDIVIEADGMKLKAGER